MVPSADPSPGVPVSVVDQLREPRHQGVAQVHDLPVEVIDSTARCAAWRIVPPGVSYTPRDFIPTYRFSTR